MDRVVPGGADGAAAEDPGLPSPLLRLVRAAIVLQPLFLLGALVGVISPYPQRV